MSQTVKRATEIIELIADGPRTLNDVARHFDHGGHSRSSICLCFAFDEFITASFDCAATDSNDDEYNNSSTTVVNCCDGLYAPRQPACRRGYIVCCRCLFPLCRCFLKCILPFIIRRCGYAG